MCSFLSQCSCYLCIDSQKWYSLVMWQFYSIFLNFWETIILFSTVAAPSYIPPAVHEGSLFSTPLPALFICYLFDDSYSDSCDIVVLICISLISGAEFFFNICMLAVCMSFEKHLFRSSAHFFNWVFVLFCFVWSWVVWAVYVFWMLTSYGIYYLQVHFPSQYIAFLSCW